MMQWLLALHIISVVCWFAGLFYLPRLFVYHAEANDQISLDRFVIMERRLYRGIMNPSAILTIIFGVSLLLLNPHYYLQQPWMHIKLTLVLLLIIYHLYLGHCRKLFAKQQNRKASRFFRILNEVPTLLLIAIVILVVVQP